MNSLTTGIKRIGLFACMISAFSKLSCRSEHFSAEVQHLLVTMRAA